MRACRLCIIDSSYPTRKHVGLAASWLSWEIPRIGGIVVEPDGAPDYVLITVNSQQAAKDAARELKRYGFNKKNIPIIFGGPGCYAPASFDSMATTCCVGEGRFFIAELVRNGIDSAKQLPNAWNPGEETKVIPDYEYPWDCPPIKHPDGCVRVHVARGCHRKCLFCQTGWESPFRINPKPATIERQIKTLKKGGERIVALCNDISAPGIPRLSGLDNGSASFEAIKNIRLSRDFTKTLRIGVEGVSERLRAAIGKPIQTDCLANKTLEAMSAGITVKWFMIAGLPGERNADYDDLKRVISLIKKTDKGILQLCFHGYMPQPASPLSVLPLEDGYYERFDSFRTWFFSGPGFSRHIQIMACAKEKGRLLRSCENMAATEKELRRGWFNDENKNWRIQYPAPPEKLRHIAELYLKKISEV